MANETLGVATEPSPETRKSSIGEHYSKGVRKGGEEVWG